MEWVNCHINLYLHILQRSTGYNFALQFYCEILIYIQQSMKSVKKAKERPFYFFSAGGHWGSQIWLFRFWKKTDFSHKVTMLMTWAKSITNVYLLTLHGSPIAVLKHLVSKCPVSNTSGFITSSFKCLFLMSINPASTKWTNRVAKEFGFSKKNFNRVNIEIECSFF
jgi:hypothetical protein